MPERILPTGCREALIIPFAPLHELLHGILSFCALFADENEPVAPKERGPLFVGFPDSILLQLRWERGREIGTELGGLRQNEVLLKEGEFPGLIRATRCKEGIEPVWFDECNGRDERHRDSRSESVGSS